MKGAELLEWLASLAPRERDAALEARFGIADGGEHATIPGADLIGYHPSGVAAIVRMVIDVPVVEDDVVIDLGAGLGKVALVTRALTGATVRGIEIQPSLVERARDAAARLGLDVSFDSRDVRSASLDDGTVFFLYVPFTGAALAEVLERLRRVATHHAIVVCALGVDLERDAPWLRRRPGESFWLALYDSVEHGAAPRRARERSSISGSVAEAVANERPLARSDGRREP
jgi:SAM-dependent methyltransferase